MQAFVRISVQVAFVIARLTPQDISNLRDFQV